MRAASREALFYWNYAVGCQGFGEMMKRRFRAIEMKGKGLGVMKKVGNNLYSPKVGVVIAVSPVYFPTGACLSFLPANVRGRQTDGRRGREFAHARCGSLGQ